MLFQSAPGGEAGGNRSLPAIAPWPLPQFQSAPGGEAGGKPAVLGGLTTDQAFQSAPGGEAGGNPTRDGPGRDRPWRFNPPPAVRPGETCPTSAI